MNYQQFSTYDNMINSKHKYQDGQMAYIADTKKVYQYKDTAWQEIIVEGGGIEVSLYEMNKQIISQMPILDQAGREKGKKLIDNMTKSISSDYYMLLCKDKDYYTLFVKDSNSNEKMSDIVIECAEFLGEVKSIDLTQDASAIEIWITDNNNSYVMYLFDYKEGVIPCII